MSFDRERKIRRKHIRTLMAHYDVNAHDLAIITGYTHAYVRGVISGAFTSSVARRKIEVALGVPPGSIWPDSENAAQDAGGTHG